MHDVKRPRLEDAVEDDDAAFDIDPNEMQKTLETMQAYIHLHGVGPNPYELSMRTAAQFAKLPAALAAFLAVGETEQITASVKLAETKNSAFVQAILDTHLPGDEVESVQGGEEREEGDAGDEEADYDLEELTKVRCALYSLVREWSEEGACEREQAFNPLLQALQKYMPVTAKNRNAQKILVPGSGLGRLVFEVAKLGYNTLGNEFSVYMLLFSFYMLNNASHSTPQEICPYIGELITGKKSFVNAFVLSFLSHALEKINGAIIEQP